MQKLCRCLGKAEKSRIAIISVNCMQSIGKIEYADHVRLCEDNQLPIIEMPTGQLNLKFVNWEKTQNCRFVVYTGLQALKVPVNVAEGKSTVFIERKLPAIFGPILVDVWSNSVFAESFHRGEYNIIGLMNCLRGWIKWCDTGQQKSKILYDVMSKSLKNALLASAGKLIVVPAITLLIFTCY